MQQHHAREEDPIGWSALIALGFMALAAIRLAFPERLYFDEIHYVPAARGMLLLDRPYNPEHPLLGKEIIAAGIALFGDKALGWRIFSWALGGIGLFAFGRALWWASQRRFATLAGMALLFTSFAWFIQSRIAMLDMAMASFAMLATWQLAAAVRLPAQGRWRLALAGLFIGLSIAAKWSIAPAAMLPGLAFFVLKVRDNGWKFLTARAGGPVPGISLIEAALWLGVVPVAVYWATFLPAFLYAERPVNPWHIIEHHRYMLQLQDSVKKPHIYQTQWWQWVLDIRGIWYLYEPIGGFQRGIVLIGNPFSMLAGLPALLWCLWAGLRRGRREALAFALAYLVSIGMWSVSTKPVQFYYHYLIPGTFLMACLALALDALWSRTDGKRWIAPAALVAAGAIFVHFYPIISAAPLSGGKPAFEYWMWLPSWR